MDEKKERHNRKLKKWMDDNRQRIIDCEITQSKIGKSIDHDSKWDHINKTKRRYYEFRNFNGFGLFWCGVFTIILAMRSPIVYSIPLWILVLVVFTTFYLVIRIKKKILNNSAGYWNAVEKFENDYKQRKTEIEKLKAKENAYNEELANAEEPIDEINKDPMYKHILDGLIRLDHKLVDHCIAVEDREKLKKYLKVGTSRKETWKAISGDLNELDYSHKWLGQEVKKVVDLIWMVPKYIGIGFWNEWKKSGSTTTTDVGEYSNPDNGRQS